MEKVLLKIAKKLNEKNIFWAIGSSYLLKEEKIVDVAHDLDIFIAMQDIDAAEKVLGELAKKEESIDNKNFASRRFLEYTIDGVEVDVIAGFRVVNCSHIYEYILDDKAVVNTKIIDGIKINYTSLEDWFVIYSLIDGRKEKAMKIKEELLKRKNINKFLLKRNLTRDIPCSLKKEIEEML